MQRLKSLWQRGRGWKGWRYLTAVRLAGAMLGLVGVGIGVWGYVTAHGPGFDWATFAGDYGANISTTLVGFTLAVLVIDALNERRANRERKRAIIQQMASPVNDAALEALRLAKIEGWDKDGSLRGVRLWRANLQGADLSEADLQRSRLREANLQKAELGDANLKGAHLGDTNLRGAVLSVANLQGADLSMTNMQEAILFGANLQEAILTSADLQDASPSGAGLQGAHLREADLQGADLAQAKFDVNTTLPDGSKWTPETDLSRFTDPNHPNFWRSDNWSSPAYRGKKEDIP